MMGYISLEPPLSRLRPSCPSSWPQLWLLPAAALDQAGEAPGMGREKPRMWGVPFPHQPKGSSGPGPLYSPQENVGKLTAPQPGPGPFPLSPHRPGAKGGGPWLPHTPALHAGAPQAGPGPEWSREGTPEPSEEDKAAAIAAPLSRHLRLGRRPARGPPARRLPVPGEGVGCRPFQKCFGAFCPPSHCPTPMATSLWILAVMSFLLI